MTLRFNASGADPLLVTIIVTAGSIAFCSTLFAAACHEYSAWRTAFSETAFTPLYNNYVFIAFHFVTGCFAVARRTWKAPFVFALFTEVTYFLTVPWPEVSSGPGSSLTALFTLMTLRKQLLAVALVIQFAILAWWIKRSAILFD